MSEYRPDYVRATMANALAEDMDDAVRVTELAAQVAEARAEAVSIMARTVNRHNSSDLVTMRVWNLDVMDAFNSIFIAPNAHLGEDGLEFLDDD